MIPILPSTSPFPHPDWTALQERIAGKALTPAELNAYWTEQGREWVFLLRDALGMDYKGYESTHFWLISAEPPATCQRLLVWAEKIYTKVNSFLGEAAGSGLLHGKIPVLVVKDLDTYNEYFAGYLADGEYAGSGGVYLNNGYGHFLFTYRHLSEAEMVIAHELTHALVSHLPIPSWLNEGVAQLCEIWAVGRNDTNYDEVRESIDGFWTAETIQGLWNGKGFLTVGPSQLQSYHLALVITQPLTGDLPRFRELLLQAHYTDAGTAALKAVYGLTPAELVGNYLGPGPWEPSLPISGVSA